MQKSSFTLVQTVSTAAVFSVITFWYGFMSGRESSRKELGDLIDSLRKGSDPTPPSPEHS